MNKKLFTVVAVFLILLLADSAMAATPSWSYVLSGTQVQQIVADGSGGAAVVTDTGIVWVDASGDEVYKRDYQVVVIIVGVTDRNLVYQTNYSRYYDVDRHGHESFINDLFRGSSDFSSTYADKFGFFGLKFTNEGFVLARYDFKK